MEGNLETPTPEEIEDLGDVLDAVNKFIQAIKGIPGVEVSVEYSSGDEALGVSQEMTYGQKT